MQKFHVAVEVDDESLVLVLADHLIEETLTCAALFAQYPPLAHAGVNQQAQGKREIGFARKVANYLRTAVFGQREVVFAESVDDFSVPVARRGKNVNHLDLDRHCGHGLIFRRRS